MPYKCTACNKSFRYKISQKSHKCPVNPPGSVVRAPVLLEKLEKNNEPLPPPEGGNNEVTINQNMINLYPNHQQTSNCIVRLDTDGNSNIITAPSIIFDATGQIIGQNFAFDGQNLIAIAAHNIVTNEAPSCVSTATNPNNNNNDVSKGNSFQKYRTTPPNTDQHQQRKIYLQINNKKHLRDWFFKFLQLVPILMKTRPTPTRLAAKKVPISYRWCYLR